MKNIKTKILVVIMLIMIIPTAHAWYEFKRDKQSLAIVKDCIVQYNFSLYSWYALTSSYTCNDVWNILVDRKHEAPLIY